MLIARKIFNLLFIYQFISRINVNFQYTIRSFLFRCRNGYLTRIFRLLIGTCGSIICAFSGKRDGTFDDQTGGVMIRVAAVESDQWMNEEVPAVSLQLVMSGEFYRASPLQYRWNSGDEVSI